MSESRGEYIERTKKQLVELNDWIDRAEERIDELSASSRARLEAQLETARRSYELGQQKLQEILDGGEESFHRLHDEAEHIWKVLRRSVSNFKSPSCAESPRTSADSSNGRANRPKTPR